MVTTAGRVRWAECVERVINVENVYRVFVYIKRSNLGETGVDSIIILKVTLRDVFCATLDWIYVA